MDRRREQGRDAALKDFFDNIDDFRKEVCVGGVLMRVRGPEGREER